MLTISPPVTTLLDDAALIERILGHVNTQTTDMEDDSWHEPVVNYRSVSRLNAEMERVLRRYSTPFCPSAALPEAGSFVARQAAGVPIVVVRGQSLVSSNEAIVDVNWKIFVEGFLEGYHISTTHTKTRLSFPSATTISASSNRSAATAALRFLSAASRGCGICQQQSAGSMGWSPTCTTSSLQPPSSG